VRLLQMIVMPLVFISVLSAITKLKQAGALGKISVSVLSILLITTAIAAAIGIAMTYLFNLSAEGLIAGERELAAQASVEGRVEKVANLSRTYKEQLEAASKAVQGSVNLSSDDLRDLSQTTLEA